MQISLFFLLSSFLPPLCQYLGCRKIKIRVESCSRLHVHEPDSWFGVHSRSSEPLCIAHRGWTPCRGCSQTLAWLQSEFRSWAAVAALFNESVSQSCSRTGEAGRGATSPLRSNKSSRGDHMWHVVLHQIHIWPHNDHATCVMKQQEEQLVLAFHGRANMLQDESQTSYVMEKFGIHDWIFLALEPPLWRFFRSAPTFQSWRR